MARNVLVDAGFLAALLSRRDSNHEWALTQAPGHAPPWRTCEAVLSFLLEATEETEILKNLR